jgi:hypothetical protein
VDYDACQEQGGFVLSDPLRLPGRGAPAARCFPLFPAGYGNGSAAERTDHALLYNFFRPARDHRVFALSNLEALLRHGDTGTDSLISELPSLCPQNFADRRVRRLVTTHSFDLDRPGLTPWVYDPRASSYQVPSDAPDQAPRGPALAFPDLVRRDRPIPPGSEFAPEWRARVSSAALRLLDQRIDLNQNVPLYLSYR